MSAICQTETELAALSRLRELTGDEDGPMERHSLRVFLLAETLARRRGEPFDREALVVAALLHDAGLYVRPPSQDAYVTDSRRVAEALLDGRDGWPPERVRLVADAIERHHELREQDARGAEVELLRQADRGEVLGVGLPRGARRGARRLYPATGLTRELGREVGRHARERPFALLGIFRP